MGGILSPTSRQKEVAGQAKALYVVTISFDLIDIILSKDSEIKWSIYAI